MSKVSLHQQQQRRQRRQRRQQWRPAQSGKQEQELEAGVVQAPHDCKSMSMQLSTGAGAVQDTVQVLSPSVCHACSCTMCDC